MAALTRDDQPSVDSQKLIGNHCQVCNRSQGFYAQILQSKIPLGVRLSEFFYSLVLMTYLSCLYVGASHFIPALGIGKYTRLFATNSPAADLRAEAKLAEIAMELLGSNIRHYAVLIQLLAFL